MLGSILKKYIVLIHHYGILSLYLLLPGNSDLSFFLHHFLVIYHKLASAASTPKNEDNSATSPLFPCEWSEIKMKCNRVEIQYSTHPRIEGVETLAEWEEKCLCSHSSVRHVSRSS